MLEKEIPMPQGAEGMSASKMRYPANKGEFETFKQGVAGDEKLAKDMYDKIRKGMGEQDLDELVVKQQKPKLDVLNNIATEKTMNLFFKLECNPDEITVGGKVFIASILANRFLRFYDGQEKENPRTNAKSIKKCKNNC